jgi:uncharacterized metal-binding protein
MSKTKSENMPNCAACTFPGPKRSCNTEDGKGITGCPTLEAGPALERANSAYDDPEVLAFAKGASQQEAACYANRDQENYVIQPSKTRIEEIIQFARRMNYKRLGLAFCIGLRNEAAVVHKLFTMREFELVSAVCKSGRTEKEFLTLSDMEKIRRGNPESICNPVYQAELMNEYETDLNILLGLCVGHDSLFIKYSKAPVTVLAVKDRVTGHNPLAPIYQVDFYYQKLKHPELDEMP